MFYFDLYGLVTVMVVGPLSLLSDVRLISFEYLRLIKNDVIRVTEW